MKIIEETNRRLSDKKMKGILSYRDLVAPILYHCIDELKGKSGQEIIQMIETILNHR